MSNNHKYDNYSDFKENIPTNWKKFGEVYCNELGEPVFVCLECWKKAKSINTAFTTPNDSSFWYHIEQQHLNDTFETIDQISQEIQNFEKNSDELEISNSEQNSKSAKDTDSNFDKTKELNLKALEIFHKKILNDTSKLQDITNTQQNMAQKMSTDNEYVEVQIKQEDTKDSVKNISNCNYYYDNETYTISDDEYDEEMQEEIYGQLKLMNENKAMNYKQYYEISDDEMDTDEQDNMITRPNTPSFLTLHKTSDVGTPKKNIFYTTNNSVEENEFHQLAIGIPTPEVSPGFNNSDYERGSECTQSLIAQPKKRTSFRRYQCQICGSRTVNEERMLIHQFKMHNKKDEVQKQYHQIEQSNENRERSFEKNANNGGLNIKPFRCKSCKTRTATDKAMKRHQELYHNPDIKVKQCELCHKRIFVNELERHMIQHTLERYKCKYCGATYKQKSYLNAHVKKNHSDENVCNLSHLHRFQI